MDVDAALAEVRGRTRYEGQPTPADEILAAEVERLREALRGCETAAVGGLYQSLGHEERLVLVQVATRLALHVGRALGDGA